MRKNNTLIFVPHITIWYHPFNMNYEQTKIPPQIASRSICHNVPVLYAVPKDAVECLYPNIAPFNPAWCVISNLIWWCNITTRPQFNIDIVFLSIWVLCIQPWSRLYFIMDFHIAEGAFYIQTAYWIVSGPMFHRKQRCCDFARFGCLANLASKSVGQCP